MLLELLHVDKNLSMFFELEKSIFSIKIILGSEFSLSILNMLLILFGHKVLLLKGLMIIYFFLL